MIRRDLPAEDLALLSRAQDAARVRRDAVQPLADVLPISLGRLASARTARPVDGLRTWCCACGVQYRATRNLGACDACRRDALARARQQRADGIRAEVMAPAGAAFAGLTLDGEALARRVAPKVIRAAQECRALVVSDDDTAFPRLLLLGGTGAGKTSLATAVFRWHLDNALATVASGGERADHSEAFARGMLWVSSMALARARREARFGAEPDLVRRARTATVLLIDDLGQEPPSEQADVVAILAERHQQEARTLVTCGFPLVADAGPSVESRYGAHLVRRLSERAHVLALPARRPA